MQSEPQEAAAVGDQQKVADVRHRGNRNQTQVYVCRGTELPYRFAFISLYDILAAVSNSQINYIVQSGSKF